MYSYVCARRFATLAHKEELNKMRMMKRTGRSTVLGANWRLANAKSSMVHESNPDAECMDEIERTERKSNAQATSHRQSCFVTRCVFFVGRADFDFFLRLENTASFINARRHAGSSQLCLLALSRSDRRSLALLCCPLLAEQRK